MIQLTDNGVLIQTFDEIFNEIANGYRAIYGNDISIDPDTPDGQRIAIQARRELDMQVFLQNVYNQLDPDVASGISLERLLKYSGIFRRPASKSQADVVINTSRALTLPEGYKVQDELGQIWETTSELELSIGDNNVTVFAENFGEVAALENTINEPATIILGVVSINNPAAATVGQDEESDQDLRLRRNRSLQNPSTSTVGGLFSSLGNVSNVTDLAIYENDTPNFDFDLSLEPHSIWIVIEGGAIDDIARTIVFNKTGGTGLKGNISGEVAEQVSVGELTFERINVVEFDRPIITDLFVRVNVQGRTGVNPNVQVISQSVSEESYNIGEEAVASRLYERIYRAQSGINASDIQISTNGVDFFDDFILANPQEKFSISPENVSITLI